MGASDAAPSGRDKTSLVVGARNEPGAVVKLLQPLADAGICMSKLESRPARLDNRSLGNWEYLFFVVSEGHRQDRDVAAAAGWNRITCRLPENARLLSRRR